MASSSFFYFQQNKFCRPSNFFCRPTKFLCRPNNFLGCPSKLFGRPNNYFGRPNRFFGRRNRLWRFTAWIFGCRWNFWSLVNECEGPSQAATWTFLFCFVPKTVYGPKFFELFAKLFRIFRPRGNFFDGPNFFQNLADSAAIRLVQKSSKSEPSSPFFGRLKFRESLSRTSSFKIFYADTK